MKGLDLSGRAQGSPVLIFHAGQILLPSGVAELEYELATMLVNRIAQGFPESNVVVTVNRGVIGNNTATNADRHKRTDDRADPSARKLDFPVNARLGARAIVIVESSGNI